MQQFMSVPRPRPSRLGQFFFTLAATCLLLPVCSLADLVYDWEFTATNQYTIADPDKVEIDTTLPGYAQLVLSPTELYDAALPGYWGAQAATRLSFGPDISLVPFGLIGTFQSRVLDRGVGSAWSRISVKYNRGVVGNLGSETASNATGLVGLWHLNTSWNDSTTNGNHVVPVSATLLSDAPLGQGSASFLAFAARALGSKGLNVSTQVTVTFWVKPFSVSVADQHTVLDLALGGSERFAVLVGARQNVGFLGLVSNALQVIGPNGFVSAAAENTMMTAADVGVWRHIAATYDTHATPTVHLYKDGVELPLFTSLATGAIPATTQVMLGSRIDANYNVPAYVDELAVYNRILTPGEVIAEYQKGIPLRVQVRSSATTNMSGSFVGLDGTTISGYVGQDENLVSVGNFNAAHRYLQYTVQSVADYTGTNYPFIEAVSFVLSNQTAISDTSLGDYSLGDFPSSQITNIPVIPAMPWLSLAKTENGAYYTNGTYTSRELDAGAPVEWASISWDAPAELVVSALRGVKGLWHFNSAWVSAVGGYAASPTGSVGFTTIQPKYGTAAASFDGNSGFTRITINTNVSTLETWIRLDGSSDGILEFQTSVGIISLMASNRVLSTIAVGAITNPLIFVNGRETSRHLLSGWNHVGLVFSAAPFVTELRVGVGNGDVMLGSMDEMAIYNVALSRGELSSRFVGGMRQVGGRVKAQVRSGSSLPLSGPFGGPSGNANAYFNSADPLAGHSGMRYMQYRLFFDSDGNGTPVAADVKLTHDSGEMLDDTLAEFVAGSFDSSKTTWHGEEIKLNDLSAISTPNLNLSTDPFAVGLWHFDETAWGAGSPDALDSRGSADGTPVGGAQLTRFARVGVNAAVFDGAGDYVSIPGTALDPDLSVGLWFKSSTTNRAALFSTYSAGASYYTLELVGNTAQSNGSALRFTIDDGSANPKSVRSINGFYNDGDWHHVVGMKSGEQLHLFADGTRVGTTNIGVYGGVAGAEGRVGRLGTITNQDLNGSVDELAIWSAGLSDERVGQIYASGYSEAGQAQFVSSVVDAGKRSIWETLLWVADAPYSKPLQPQTGLNALWRMETATGNTITNSVGANNGTVAGATLVSTGRFDKSLSFDGANDSITVVSAAALEPSALTIECWVMMDATDSRIVIDKSNGSDQGYVLGTDAEGRPYFWIGNGAGGGTTCTGLLGIRAGKWTHLAGTYVQSGQMRLYVDGHVAANASVAGLDTSSGASLVMGESVGGTGDFDGYLDEVAIHSIALIPEEVFDHYRAAAVTLKFQARVANSTSALASASFVGPGGLSTTYFNRVYLTNTAAALPLGQYYQYKAFLSTEDHRLTPRLDGVRVTGSSYPDDNPTIQPGTTNGFPFTGNLLGFSNILVQGAGTDVKYQISGHSGGSPTWYYWSSGTSNWVAETGNGYNGHANYASEINANIGSFYKDLYDKVGGLFRFRAFLHSGGDQQVQIDRVRLVASKGSITLIQPDINENGNNAWMSGVTNTIRWSSAGSVSSNFIIRYSEDAGTNWNVITTNAPNTGTYSWGTRDSGNNPLLSGDRYRVRVEDDSDLSIFDESDVDFQIRQGLFHLKKPNGGEIWYTGETNAIVWIAPTVAGSFVPLWVNALGATGWLGGEVDGWDGNVIGNVSNIATKTNNTYQWVIPKDNSSIISESARIGVSLDGAGLGFDGSDSNFTIAGIRIIQPEFDAPLNRRDTTNIVWVSAGGDSHNVKLELSLDGGSTWSTVTNSYPNDTGTNSFSWVIASSNPTLNAILRATSLQQPRLWGESPRFNIADIDIRTPAKGTNWWIGETNDIIWTQGGAGNNVDLYYSTNNFLTQTEIVLAQGTQDFPSENTNSWLIPPNPSTVARVKVQSVANPSISAISSNFNISGLLVESPNASTNQWVYGTTSTITWGYAGLNSAYISVSYDNGASYLNVTNITVPLSNRKYSFLPFQPTRFARIRMIAEPQSNRLDYSDTNFVIAGVKVVAPTNRALYTLTQNIPTGIQFFAAGTYPVGGNNPTADVYYSSSGTGNWLRIATVLYNESANLGLTALDWTSDVVRDADPSTNARIRVLPVISGSPYEGLSPSFTARGLRVTRPATNTLLDIGGYTTNRWIRAGIDASAFGEFYLSADGGASFPTNPIFGNVNVGAQTNVPWTIAQGFLPSTSTVLRLVITNSLATNDIGYICDTRPFTLRGTKITSPSNGTVWVLGTVNTVVVQSVGLSDVGTLYYSGDGGVTYDLANPLLQNFSLLDGQSNLTVTIGSRRHAGTNIVLKLVSGIYSSETAPFTVEGIKVTTPIGTDILALGDTNQIQWVTAGTLGTYTMDVITNGVVVESVPGITATNYAWPVNPAAVGTGVLIRITDSGGYVGYSEPVEIVDQPLIRILSPTNGQYLRVSETASIVWAKGGLMPSTFDVYYSSNNFATKFLLTNSFALVNGQYRMDWPLDNYSLLGNMQLLVTNTTDPTIFDSSDPFWLVSKIHVTAPAQNDTNFALRPTLVQWNTWGNITNVDLYYSSSLTKDVDSWTKVNTTFAISNNAGTLSAMQSFYDWTPPNVTSLILWVRIQDRNFTNIFPTTVPGPYDDCDGPFSIRRYSITWNVYDSVSSNLLDELSVVDSSGWSQSGMTAPIIRDYPYGTWDTVWYRDLFHNKVVFQWFADSNMTINVPMDRSTVAPDYHVMGDFTFDSTNREYSINTWLERTGSVISDPTETWVDIYDEAGTLIATIPSSSPDANGVFWLNWDVAATETTLGYQLGDSDPLFARVTIVYSGTEYNSGVIFTLTVAGAPDYSPILDAIEQARQAASNAVAGVSNQVASVATNVSAATTGINALTTNLSAGVSNILADINSNRADVANLATNLNTFRTNTADRLDMLTNEVMVAGRIASNMYSYAQTNLGVLAQSDLARILSRPNSVTNGQLFTILYKTRSGYGSGVSMSLTNGAFNVNLGAMTELYAGIYESAPIVANWPTNEYKLICSDPGASDAITLAVVGPLELTVTIDLAPIAIQLSNLTASVSTVLTAVTSISTNLNPQFLAISNTLVLLESNLQARIQGVSNEVAGVTNMIATNVMPRLTTISIDLAGLSARISNEVIPTLYGVSTNATFTTNSLVSNVMPRLATISADLLILSGRVTNEVIPTLAMVGASTAYTTNVLATTVLPQLGTLAQMSNLLAGASNQMLSTVMPALYGISNLSYYTSNQIFTAIVPALAGLSGQVTGVAAQVTGVSNQVIDVASQTRGVSNQVIDVRTGVAGVSNQVIDVASQTRGVSNQVTELRTNTVALVGGVSNQVIDVAAQTRGVSNQVTEFRTNTMALVGGVSNQVVGVGTQVAGVSNQVIDVRSGVTGVSNQVIDVRTGVSGVSNQVIDVAAQTRGVSNQVTEFRTNTVALVGGVSNQLVGVGTQVAGVSNQVIDVRSGVTGVSNQVIGVRSGVTGVSNQVIDVASQTRGVSNQVIDVATQTRGVSNQVAEFRTNAIALVGGVSNQVTELRTNTMSLVAGLSNQVIDVATQTRGVSNQVAEFRTNTVELMGGVSNQIVGVTNQIAGVAAQVAGVSVQVSDFRTNTVALLGGVSDQIENAQAIIDEINGDLTLVGADVDQLLLDVAGIANVDLSGSTDFSDLAATVTDIQSALTDVSTAIGDIDLSALNTIELNLGELGENLSEQLDNMLTSESFAGELSQLESLLSGLSDESSKKASSAKTEATAAAEAAEEIKTELQSGNLSSALAYLQELKESLDKAKTNMDDIPTEIKVDALYEQLAQMAEVVNATALEGGFENLLNLGKIPEDESKADTQQDTLLDLQAKVLDVQSAVRWIEEMAKDEFKKPQVDFELRGVE